MKPLLICLLLSACSSAPVVQQSFVANEWTMRMVVVEYPDTVCREKGAVSQGGTVAGCSVLDYTKEHRICTVYVRAPLQSDDHRRLSTIGHEVWHCARGDFHQD